VRELWRSSARIRAVVYVGVGLSAACIAFLVIYPFTHSITRDAFVESHLVNLAPQVTGEVTEMYAMEQEAVKRGQIIARIDPAAYQRKRDVAVAELKVTESALRQAKTDLTLLRATVPKRIEIAVLDAVQAEKSRDAAAQAVEAAKADRLMAKEDVDRFTILANAGSSTVRRKQEAVRAHSATSAIVALRQRDHQSAKAEVGASVQRVELAKLGDVEIVALEDLVLQRESDVEKATRQLELAELNLSYTEVVAPFDGIIAKKWRYPGDYAHVGSPIVTLYNPDLLYVTAHLPETLLEGVKPGNTVTLDVRAFDGPFAGRVLWVGSATGAEFSLIPRDIASGEFTYIVQRVPIRIWIEGDKRFALLKPGLSVTASIDHGEGDPKWAAEAWAEQARIEGLMRRASDPSRGVAPVPSSVPLPAVPP
jgi:membrane fusion protein, multidrug efflux system